MNKRARGTGSLYLRGELWSLKYYKNGVAVREPSGTASRKQAEKLLQQRLGQIAADTYIEPSNRKLTIDALYQALIDHYRVQRKASCAETEARWQRQPAEGKPVPEAGRLKKWFSGMLALALTTEKLNKFVKWCQEEQKLEDGTINRDLGALRRAFTLAKETGVITRIPHFPMLPEARPREGFLEYSDYLKLCQHAPELWLRTVLACVYLGMRKGEVVGGWREKFRDGLKVRHVDLGARNLRLTFTKNGDDRIVPMSAELYPLMVACCAGKSPEDWVFTRSDGSQVKDFYDRWQRLLREAGVRGDLMVHDTRRSAVRNMERAGVSRSVAMKISGHKTESVYRRYAIVKESDLAEGISKVDAAKRSWSQNGHNFEETAPETGTRGFPEADVTSSKSTQYN